MSDKYEGLQFLKEHINDMLSDDEMEVYLKLYLLLYADDIVRELSAASVSIKRYVWLLQALESWSEYK